jgi:hypothetical protein
MNEIQLIGSHNSYKIAIEEDLWKYVYSVDSAQALSLQYDHVSIVEQLKLGLRSFEIDVFYDPHGGHFSKPKGLKVIEEMGGQAKPFDQEENLKQPGLKVFHIQDIDFRSHNLLFKDELEAMKQWSQNNIGHMPIIILINAKDEQVEQLRPVLPFTSEALASIDQEIRAVFSPEQLITPDLVRGEFANIQEAVLSKGWPQLDEMRNRFMFVLDESKTKTNRYLDNFPGLEKACLFVNLPEGNPEAAFMVINDPVRDFDKIQQLVKKGYMVRTRSDAGTIEARNNDYSRFEKAKASGAQVISTDYYHTSKLFPSTYKVQFDNGTYELIKSN